MNLSHLAESFFKLLEPFLAFLLKKALIEDVKWSNDLNINKTSKIKRYISIGIYYNYQW